MTDTTMPRVWLTSDTHFGHENIIKYCNRPFNNAWHMNTALANIWQSKVTDDDILIHLGDLTLIKDPHKYRATWGLIKSLPGKKILVRGNHDHSRIIPHLQSIGWVVVNEIESENVFMRHIPPSSSGDADMICAPDILLHGHIHGKSRHHESPNGMCFDMGVDASEDYGPMLMSDFLRPEDMPRVTKHLNDLYNLNVRNTNVASPTNVSV